MGLDAYSYMYLCLSFDDVYDIGQDVQEYEIHDSRTGKKTGQKGFDTVDYYLNRHTGEKYYCDRYELPTEEHTMDISQEGSDRIIGFKIARCSSGDELAWIPEQAIDLIRNQFENKLRPFVGDLEPKLLLNLYLSY